MKLFGFLERSAMLKDAITLFAPVVKIIPIKKDEKVGYDFAYKAPSDGYITLYLSDMDKDGEFLIQVLLSVIINI